MKRCCCRRCRCSRPRPPLRRIRSRRCRRLPSRIVAAPSPDSGASHRRSATRAAACAGRRRSRATGAACSPPSAPALGGGAGGNRRASARSAQRRSPGRALHRQEFAAGRARTDCSPCSPRRPSFPRPGSCSAWRWRAARPRRRRSPANGASCRWLARPGAIARGPSRRARRRCAARSRSSPWSRPDRAPEAEALFQQSLPLLSFEARAEAAQRVAWIYYVLGRDARCAPGRRAGLPGAVGEWAAQAHWIAGLASWRLNDCDRPRRHFRAVANGRAESRTGRRRHIIGRRGRKWPAAGRVRSAPLLKAAARSPESFYGLVARETLGMDKSLPAATRRRPNSRVESLPNVRRALLLAEIGEYGVGRRNASPPGADRQSGRSCGADRTRQAARFCRRRNIGSPTTARRASRVPAAARFPLPRWTPSGGWRVDPALAFAHARQESDFRAGAVSPAGAVGLMQVRPGTAGDFARGRGNRGRRPQPIRRPTSNMARASSS